MNVPNRLPLYTVGALLLFAAASWWCFGGAAPGVAVVESGMLEANGIYAWQRSFPRDRLVRNPAADATQGSTRVPNFMGLLTALQRQSRKRPTEMQRVVGTDRVTWVVAVNSRARYSYEGATGEAVPYPPETGWVTGSKAKDPPPQMYLRGSRPSWVDTPESEPSTFWKSPAMVTLRTQPVNTAIILACIRIWFLLRGRRWGWPEVGSSYRKVMYEGEVWRLVTASFSHVDLMHLGMNMMSLYQIGMLEVLYGSALYAVYSAVLVILTMVVGLIIYHVLITRYGKEQYIETIGVGYSCVLFALIVVATAKTEKYCPIPGLGDLCFPTWQLKVPMTSVVLPFNAAPFGLLVAMHFIVPKASFIGHLAGIVMGYPLVWGGLDWFGLQVLARFCVLAVIFRSVWAQRRNAAVAMATTSGTSTPPNLKLGHLLALSGDHGATSRLLAIPAAVLAVGALVAFPGSTWQAAPCDVTGAALAVVAWKASAGYASPEGITPLRTEALVAVAGMAATDVLTGLARIGMVFSLPGGAVTWLGGLVSPSYMAAAVVAAVAIPANALLVYAVLQALGATDQQASTGGPLWFVPSAMRPTVTGLPSASVIHNGVITARGQGAAAGSVPSPSQGRRLGTV